MLAEIAAANAAFSVIRTALQNGKQLADVASQVGAYVNATEDARKKADKQKRRSGGEDLEAFVQLERLKQQEEHLKQWMIYAGRPGLWQDWQKFQAQARKERLAEAERKRRRRREIIELCGYAIAFLAILSAVVGLVVWAWFLKGM